MVYKGFDGASEFFSCWCLRHQKGSMYSSEDQAKNSNEIPNDLSLEEQRQLDDLEQEERQRNDRQPTLTWSPESQQRLLGCIVVEPRLAEAAELMEFRSEYFADEAHAALGKIVIDFRAAYGRHPDDVEVRHEISKLPDAKRMRTTVETSCVGSTTSTLNATTAA